MNRCAYLSHTPDASVLVRRRRKQRSLQQVLRYASKTMRGVPNNDTMIMSKVHRLFTVPLYVPPCETRVVWQAESRRSTDNVLVLYER